MKKTSKLIWMLCLLPVMLFGLSACKDDETVEQTGGVVDVDEEVIYSPYVSTTLLLGEDVEASDVSLIRNAYYKMVGKEITVNSSNDTSASHLIIVGRTEHELSEKAYRYLSGFKQKDDHVGYVIYSDGRSIAIAFDDYAFGEAVAFNEAVEAFVSEYMQSESLKLSSGAVCKASFDPIEKQKERDEATTDRLWELKISQISAKLGGDEETASAIVKELQALRHVYNDDYSTVKWLANLYDPVTGGFYYSNSARNNAGFAPDLGSTSQALGLIESILVGYGGTLTDYFGEEIADKFVSFTKSMQDENGYFYHPQWTRDHLDSSPERKNIDVTNALNILELFGASPTYDTPNRVKGDGIVPVSALTLPLRESSLSAVSAVSEVVSSAGDELYIPSYLKSKEAFNNYLSGLNIKSDVAGACKTLNSELPLYIAVDEILEEEGAGYSLCDILETYLYVNQNSTTGLWSSSSSVTYETVGELVSIINIYNALEAPVPNYGTVIESICGMMMFETEPDDISDISSVWMALDCVVNNIQTYVHEFYRDDVNSYIYTIHMNFGSLVSVTKEKLLLFANDDGSFGSTEDGSAYLSYGMSVAIPLSEEGDMNATLLATKNLWLSIFGVLGVGDVPIFNTSDRMMFQKTLLDMGVIIKNEVKKTEPEDYESYEVGESANVSVTAKDSYEKYAEITESGDDHGKVMHIYSSVLAGQDQFHIGYMSSVASATCCVYDLDICVLPEQSEGLASFIYVYKAMHMIGLERSGDEVRIVERSNQWSDAIVTDLGVRAKIGEWFNLRVEYYPGNNDTVRTKIYFNGVCVAATNNYVGKEVAFPAPKTATAYEGVSIFSGNKKETSLLIDNVVTESTYATYTAETSSTLNVNIDTPDKSQEIYTFEDSVVGSTPLEFTVSGSSSAAKVTTDSSGNNSLAISEGAGEIILPIDQRGIGTNSAVIEFDFTVDENSAAGAKYQISFNEFMYSGRCFGAMQLLVMEENGQKYVTMAEVASGKTGTVYTHVRLELGVKYHLRLQIFYAEGALLVSVGTEELELVGLNTNVLTNAVKYYMRETTIEALTSSVKSTIYVDNLISERIVSDYDKMTAASEDRMLYDFETASGETYGVEPSDGVLSFENAGAGAAYVKIPVNVRATVTTMAVIGFDVIEGSMTSGEMIIEFTDAAGNIISAFELVKTSAGVAIYERTASGRYNTPMHTVLNSSFNISIEYSASQESFNILIDGSYVAASSLSYTADSADYLFKYLKVSTSGNTGFIIDNLYAEEICGSFKAHSVSMENTDGSKVVIDYETSSFASLPSKLSFSVNAVATTSLIKASTINGAVTKVFEFYHAKSTSTEHVIISKTASLAGANAIYFETYMMLKSTGEKMQAVFDLMASGTAYRLTVETEGPGEPIKVLGGKSGVDFSAVLDDVNEGEWFKLRFEYRDTPDDFDYDGDNDCFVRVYINDDLIGEGHTPYTTLTESARITKIRLNFAQTMEGYMYLDDTSLCQFDMDYEKPLPADTDTLTYEPGVVTYQTAFSFGNSTSTAKISSLTDTEGNVNKVLDFYTSSDSADKLGIIVTSELETANAVMFETDIMIDPTSDSTTLYLEPQNASGKQPFRLILTAEKDGNVTISASDITKKTIGKSGEWIHIRVEYMNPMLDYTGDRKSDILYKVYVGEGDEAELVATGYQLYTAGAYYDPLTLTKFVITTEQASEANIYLDNTRFWQVERTADEAPKFTETDDYHYGNTEIDYGAWV